MASSIDASTSGAGGVITTADNTGILQLKTAGTTAVTVDASQNVGIGTTSPSSKLQVEGNFLSATGLLVKDTTSGSGLSSYFNASNYTDADCIIKVSQVGAATKYVSIGPSVSIPLTFRTNDTERMRIDSSGNVFVGTSTILNNEKFGVYQAGSGLWTICTKNDTRGTLTTLTSASGIAHYFLTSSTTYAGQISVSGATTSFTSASDYRLKENIRPIENALDKVAQLKPVTFTFKQDGMASEGFIAHELQEVIPLAVTGEKDAVDKDGNPEYQGVDPAKIVATLTAAIQEQQTIIKTQSESIDDLKARVTALEAK